MHDVVVGEHDTLSVGELGFDRRADHTATGEAGERPLLVEDLAGHERQAEHLGVRVRDERAGLATVVDDDLGVANLRRRGVLGEPALQHEHQLFGLVVGEVLETAVVVGREDQHLVDAARLGRHVDGPRWCTTKPVSPWKAGYRLGRTRIRQCPPSSNVSRAGSVPSSCRGRTGTPAGVGIGLAGALARSRSAAGLARARSSPSAR